MANQLYNTLNGGKQQPQQTQQPQQMNLMQMVQQFYASPSDFVKSKGKSIPEGMRNPMQIVQYLVQSGQFTNGYYQNILQQLQQMTGRK